MNTPRKLLHGLFALLLAVALLPLPALGEALPPLVITEPDKTPAPSEAPAPVFEPLKAPKGAINRYYTALKLPGYEHTVYAFTAPGGMTQFRVYGRLDKKRGMYEAAVTLTDTAEGAAQAFVVEVIGTKPVKDANAAFAAGKPLKLSAADVPEGYRTTTKPGVIWFTNLFGQKEYRVLGQVQGIGDAWYPAANGKPRRGSLAIDIAQDAARFRADGAKYLKVPRELRNGFALPVFVFTTDGVKVTALTDKPVLNVESLK